MECVLCISMCVSSGKVTCVFVQCSGRLVCVLWIHVWGGVCSLCGDVYVVCVLDLGMYYWRSVYVECIVLSVLYMGVSVSYGWCCM